MNQLKNLNNKIRSFTPNRTRSKTNSSFGQTFTNIYDSGNNNQLRMRNKSIGQIIQPTVKSVEVEYSKHTQ